MWCCSGALSILKKKLSPNQSGFRPKDSCENQLLPTVHGIFADFDQSTLLEVRAQILDIWRAFDKVWHEGLLDYYKIQVNCLTSLKASSITESKE